MLSLSFPLGLLGWYRLLLGNSGDTNHCSLTCLIFFSSQAIPKSATLASTWSRRLLRRQLRCLRSHLGALCPCTESAPGCERRRRNCHRSRRRDHVEAEVADFGIACNEKKIRHYRSGIPYRTQPKTAKGRKICIKIWLKPYMTKRSKTSFIMLMWIDYRDKM